ncbi:MAG: dihydropteroate synthase [Armatimonadota bacterium]
MMTARVLVLGHPDDRREVVTRFQVDDEPLAGPTLLITGLDENNARRLAAAVRASGPAGVPAAAASADAGDLLLAGSWRSLAGALEAADRVVAELCATAVRRFDSPPPALIAGAHRLPMDGRPLIVGILNATPDSFYDGGRYFGLDRSIARAEQMVEEGAEIIEVGGETARPSVPVISIEEEIGRIRPVIQELVARVSVPIGIDTYKPEVARAAVAAGASIVNDISGLADDRMALIAAGAGAALVVMHIQGRPKVANEHAQYLRVMDEVYAFLAARTARAEALTVRRESLVVDPGLSFGKQVAHDVTLVRRLRELRGLGLPIYLAPSRKNFIRDLLQLPFDELLEGTMAVVACGVLAGANLIRTHDVRATRRFVTMLEAITGPTPPLTAAVPAGDP